MFLDSDTQQIERMEVTADKHVKFSFIGTEVADLQRLHGKSQSAARIALTNFGQFEPSANCLHGHEHSTSNLPVFIYGTQRLVILAERTLARRHHLRRDFDLGRASFV